MTHYHPIPASRAAPRTLVDPFGRRIDYLRLSVTDRCDLRCVYCMPANQKFLPKKDVLTLDEIDALCSAFIRLGVRKLRLSGGEPLLRRGFVDLVRTLSRHLDSGALDELTLTTNGTRLAEHAAALAAAGVRRINVSLDSLDPGTFERLTRYVNVAETGGRLGFITPLTHNFCASCNRVRLTATGMLYLCLGQEDHADLRTPLRDGVSDDELDAIIIEAIARKPEKHDFHIARGGIPSLSRPMSRTGG